MDYGLIAVFILIVSVLFSLVLIRFKYNQSRQQVKWALFTLYFWVFNFLQLIAWALVYQLTKI